MGTSLPWTVPGSLCQGCTALSIPSMHLNLPWYSLMLFPLVMSLFPGSRLFLFLYDACSWLPFPFLLRTKGLALCEHVRVTDWENLPGHFTPCSCLLCGGFVLTQQCCDFVLCTSTEEPASHPSLSLCLQPLESETFGLSGWHSDTFLEL